ncbi:MAG: hypothetical protein AABX40_01720 [Candidatus Hydrothermarchaeota archaeon]
MAVKAKVTIYRYGGRFLFYRITQDCEECELSVRMARGIARELGEEKVEIEVKPWLDHFMEALLKGGWHTPIILINGRKYSQGVVPQRAEFMEAILRAMGE